jgi:predicted RNase H-like HicB family nuclease
MAKQYYPAVLERGAKGIYAVWLPDFPDSVAGGATQEDAIQKAEFVLAQAVDLMFEREQSLPEPTPIEKIAPPRGSRFVAFILIGVEPPDPSERVNIYLPKSLITRADKRAAELGMSRSSFFGLAVSSTIGWTATSFAQIAGPRSKAQQVGPVSTRQVARKTQE